MARQSRKPVRETEVDATQPLERLASFNSAATNAAMQAGRACVDMVTALNGEMLGFVNQRWRDDMDFGRCLARCSNLTDAASLQQDWTRRAMAEYTAEVTKLTRLASGLVMEGLDPVLRQAAASAATMTKPPAR